MNRSSAIKVVKKLKLLAEETVGGERESAVNKLRSFCEKYDLDEREYSTEIISVSFSYKNEEEKILLSNIICMVLEVGSFSGKNKNNTYSFKCSPYKRELIQDAFNYYKKIYQEYCEAVLTAMITKNEIINTNQSVPFSMEPMTDEEKAEQQRTSEELRKECPESDSDNSAKKSTPTKEKVTKEEIDRRQERASRILSVMETNKWKRHNPPAKLFLS